MTTNETMDESMSEPVSQEQDRSGAEAARLRREVFSDELLDQLLASAGERGVSLTGKGGFLPEMLKSVLERGMDAELTSHPGLRGCPRFRGTSVAAR